jgi:hypothetical protein
VFLLNPKLNKPFNEKKESENLSYYDLKNIFTMNMPRQVITRMKEEISLFLALPFFFPCEYREKG